MGNEIYNHLKQLTRQELVARSRKLVVREREILVEILQYLMVVNDRRVYLELGFKSLFEFCVKELGYSEGAAYRRIQAMRLLREAPEIKEKVVDGAINLTQITQVQRFARHENKAQQKSFGKAEKLGLLKQLEKKSTRESECVLRELSPLTVNKDSVRVVTVKRDQKSDQPGVHYSEIKFTADAGLLNKLEEIKALVSHKNMDPSFNELFHEMADLALEKLKKVKCGSKTSAPIKHSVDQLGTHKALKPSTNNPRYIPSTVKHEVWFRDKGCCSYKDPKTQKICGSRFQLEYDHIKPVAFGGNSNVENVRLLCREHNQYLGFKYIQNFRDYRELKLNASTV